MSTTLLLLASITSMVLQNCLFNKCCKTRLKSDLHINLFNITMYAVCIVIFGLLMFKEKISVFTVLLGLLFGVVTALSNSYKLAALTTGPMHITLLVTTSSMIIPAMSGIFFGETFSVAKLGVVIVLIACIYLSIPKSSDAKISMKWLLSCALAFIFQGSVGIIQKIHQSSVHKAEVSGFLFFSFICATVFCLIRNRGIPKQVALDKATVIIGIVSGGCSFAMNYINLKLSGLLPSQLFFPLINGSAIILSSVMAVVLFKENLSKRQTVGLIGGILSLIGICFVP